MARYAASRWTTLAAVVLCAPSALARTWIVDAQLGAGSHFRTIQAAVDAAADGDTILVRQGGYHEHVRIDGKGLHLVGLGGANLFATSSSTSPAPVLQVVNLPAGRVCHVRSLALLRISGVPGDGVLLANNVGRVWVEELFVDNYDGPPVRITGSAEVMLSEVIAQANSAFRDAQGVARPSAGMLVEAGSRVRIFGGRALGSGKPPARVTPTAPVAGGDGLRVLDSIVDLVEVELRGGAGGSMLVANCRTARIGGAGLHVAAPGALATAATVRGGRITAGVSGIFDPGCAPDPGVAPAIADPLGVVTVRGGTSRVLVWPALPGASGAFDVAIRGAPSELCFVLVALHSIPATGFPGVDGSLFLSPASWLLAFHGQLDARGSLAFVATPSPIGPVHLHAQTVHLDGGGGLWLSNPGTITLR